MRLVAALSLVVVAACSSEPEIRSSEQALVEDITLPERMVTEVALGDDRTGDLRPEALAILEATEVAGAPLTLGDLADLRMQDGAPVIDEALHAFNPPATIRIWRRGVDGSSSSCSGRVDVIPFDTYVKGVLPHEWITSWHVESLKAGAVVIRTYAAAWIGAGGKYDCADLDDTTASQVYKDEFLPKTDAAVDATAGIYVVKNGDLVFAEYSAENSDPTEFGVSEPHCSGLAVYGHGRGTCQWGSQRWATNAGKTYDWIATHYYPGSELVGLEQVNEASFAAESYELEMTSGDELVVYLEYENTGNTTWSITDTLVGTAAPHDRASAFFVDGNWDAPSRPTGADHSNYSPGSVGRFTWLMRAPEVAETTTFSESFALVTGAGEWFGDEVTWTITVHPIGGGPAAPGGDEPDQQTPGDEMAAGGCSAAGGAGPGLALLLLAGLLLPLVRRRHTHTVLAATTALIVGIAGCQAPAGPDAARTDNALGGDSELLELFFEAERTHAVPAEILATISYVETRLRFVGAYDDGTEKNGHGHAGAVGLMALSEGGPRDLVRAAALTGLPESDVHTDPRANVLGAAALLAEQARTLADRPRTLEDWRPVVVAYGGEELATEIYRRIELGWRGLDRDGGLIVHSARRTEVAPDGIGTLRQGVGYPGAIWNPAHSSNYANDSRGSGQINYIIIHTVQGSYGSAINWFKNSTSNVSAHYVTKSSNGEITQMVDDRDVAWHDACFNSQTIGIEHEGYVDDPGLWYTDAMYAESARLTSWLADQYGIPKDRAHIMGHGEAPDCSSHTDPGGGWDWDKYMALVVSGGQPTYEATYTGQDSPTQLVSGEEAVVWFEFANGSNVTWDLDKTRLGTAEPQDRASAFYVDGNWLSPDRATGADHSNYAPGAVGRFTFLIRAPEVSQPTEFVEHFRLVQEGETWFGPVVSMTVTVTPPGWDPDQDPDPETGDPRDGVFPGGSPLHHDDPSVSSAGGCSSSGGGAGSAACAMLLACALLVRRKRARV